MTPSTLRDAARALLLDLEHAAKWAAQPDVERKYLVEKFAELAAAFRAALEREEAGPYVPRVGDVVGIGDGYELVLVDFTPGVEIRKAWILKYSDRVKGPRLVAPRFDSWVCFWPDPIYLRPATAAERAAAGLPVEGGGS